MKCGRTGFELLRQLDSQVALGLILAVPPPVFLGPIQELELRTALRLKEARGEISTSEKDQVLIAIDSDIQTGFYRQPPSINWTAVFARAESLSTQFAIPTLSGTLDILHIAIVIEERISDLCSFDQRQRDLALMRCGLTVAP